MPPIWRKTFAMVNAIAIIPAAESPNFHDTKETMIIAFEAFTNPDIMFQI